VWVVIAYDEHTPPLIFFSSPASHDIPMTSELLRPIFSTDKRRSTVSAIAPNMESSVLFTERGRFARRCAVCARLQAMRERNDRLNALPVVRRRTCPPTLTSMGGTVSKHARDKRRHWAERRALPINRIPTDCVAVRCVPVPSPFEQRQCRADSTALMWQRPFCGEDTPLQLSRPRVGSPSRALTRLRLCPRFLSLPASLRRDAARV
jgi:hypothetical protein